jgi:hypothetical protein
MNGTAPSADDPRLLLEAARVFNAAGSDYRTIAEVVAELALKEKAKADPDVRLQIIGDAAALRLSGRVPGGYQQALELLKDVRDLKEDDPDGRLHLLRALARGQKYRDEGPAGKPKDDQDRAALRAEIVKDLTFAFEQRESLKAANRHFWQLGGGGDDDLLQVWKDDKEFQKLVWLPGDAPADDPKAGPARPTQPPAAATAPSPATIVPRDPPTGEPLTPPPPPEPSRRAGQASTDTEPER